MKLSDCFQIGIINKLHGFKGELLMKFTFSDFMALPKLKAILIEKNHHLIPFFIRTVSIRSDGKAVIGIDGIENEKQASELLNGAVYLQNKFLPVKKLSEPDLKSFIGITVKDVEKGEIGIVEDILEYPGNRVLQIRHQEGKEILIPAIQKLIIKKIDQIAGFIQIDAPEGLIDLYLSDTQNEEKSDEENPDFEFE
jgi:16S rRNA processing protein RimM